MENGNDGRLPESVLDELSRILIRNPSRDAVESRSKARYFTAVVESRGDGTLVSEALKSAIRDSFSFEWDFIADCISCLKVFNSGPLCKDVVVSINESLRECCGPFYESILIGLLELFAECGDDEVLFDALYSSNQYGLINPLGNDAVKISKEGKGRLTNAINQFLREVWNFDHEFGQKRLEQTLILLQRWSLIYGSGSALIFPDLTHKDPEQLFEYFLSELSARLFLQSNWKTRLRILSTFITRSQSVVERGGYEKLKKKYPHFG